VTTAAKREVLLGWRNSSPQAALAFYPPVPLAETEDGRAHGSALALPGVPGFAEHTYVIRSPWNVQVRAQKQPSGETLFGLVPGPGGLSQEGFRGLGEPFKPEAWRVAENPVFQLSLNLFFISDEPCSVQLMPPFLSPTFRKWPGTLICGRYPITSWPRPLNAALEWQQQSEDWVVKRGEPIAYVQPIYDDPDVVPVLVEAEMTPALKRHATKLDNVARYARNVSPMFERAEETRPPVLLKPKKLA